MRIQPSVYRRTVSYQGVNRTQFGWRPRPIATALTGVLMLVSAGSITCINRMIDDFNISAARIHELTQRTAPTIGDIGKSISQVAGDFEEIGGSLERTRGGLEGVNDIVTQTGVDLSKINGELQANTQLAIELIKQLRVKVNSSDQPVSDEFKQLGKTLEQQGELRGVLQHQLEIGETPDF